MGLDGIIVSAGDGATRAVPVPNGLVLDVAGRRIEVRPATPGSEQLTIAGLRPIEPVTFDVCPICLTLDPRSREHVPPRSIGGRVVTTTCRTCNSGFGGTVEPDLRAWLLDAYVNSRASGSGARGRRRLPTVYRRETQDGEFVLLVDGTVDPSVRAMLDAGDLTWEVRPPHMPNVRAAALKSAYLAACLSLRAVPDTADSRAVRALLTRVRDGANPTDADTDGLLADLRLARTHQPPAEHPVLLGHDAASPSAAYLVLAGRVAVSWPLTDIAPPAPSQSSRQLV